ncbi:M28 family metallopeptidase [Pedobacter cryotolerans]|uniref:M28 family peptidase n=1 Tax=Pedobacter cryotolerans TaxID=2571270 RepID=A0A4U1CBW7_9SPHI|nr:M28 family peptidase [Pedobacter cryotolerans]TKC02073.1 M28 family peptidase [Pedobacter cryotolerans]
MRKLLIISIWLISANCFAQDLKYARKTLNTLTSKELWGRGYTKNGMAKAANFIESEFKSFGLQPMDGKDFKQPFMFSVNTFPDKMKLIIDGKKLIPGNDFIVHQASVGLKAKTDLEQKDSVNFLAASSRILVTLEDKLTWSVSQKVEDYTQILIKKSALSSIPKNIVIDIENQFIPDFSAANIAGFIKGTAKPDSTIVITAHYDHLGGMGSETFFPGANDNGSGVSFLLSLAKHYAKNPPKYSIAFICFAAEEAGILGSKYFTENPLIPLDKIKFLINVDMVGTGETGATVVNATQYPKEFKLLNKVNEEGQFLVKINPRGKAANSDHYFFTEKGVPAFFMYTQGGISAYHDVFDKPQTLPFTVYENLFKLFVGFNQSLMN